MTGDNVIVVIYHLSLVLVKQTNSNRNKSNQQCKQSEEATGDEPNFQVSIIVHSVARDYLESYSSITPPRRRLHPRHRPRLHPRPRLHHPPLFCFPLRRPPHRHSPTDLRSPRPIRIQLGLQYPGSRH